MVSGGGGTSWCVETALEATASMIMCPALLFRIIRLLLFFFFFQAEDGIRDLIVTGVQTCALPIWFWLSAELHVHNHQNPLFVDGSNVLSTHLHHIHLHVVASGIEPSVWIRLIEIGRASCRERCRSRWSPYH